MAYFRNQSKILKISKLFNSGGFLMFITFNYDQLKIISLFIDSDLIKGIRRELLKIVAAIS